MIQNAYYSCNLCFMRLKTKRERDKHMILQHGSINENSIEKPTLLRCIVDLSKRVEELEKKLADVQPGNIVKSSPKTIQEFLEEYTGIYNYSTWIRELEIEDDDLDYLFQNNREACIVRILNKNKSDLPLLCLIENPNVIYKYEGDCWQVFENEEFKSFILILTQRITFVTTSKIKIPAKCIFYITKLQDNILNDRFFQELPQRYFHSSFIIAVC